MQLFKPGDTKGSYDSLCASFTWKIPERFNMGAAAGRFGKSDPDRIALYYENDKGTSKQFTFGEVLKDSYRLANVLVALGVQPGDRVGIVLPQRVEACLLYTSPSPRD